uniref:Uncharacterized protein n=1 Tax=Arundo donax TaxID=35708 RepID=A0A0A9H7U5_ARUDO
MVHFILWKGPRRTLLRLIF